MENKKTITYKFTKRGGVELTGVLVKQKEYYGVNYYFIRDEQGKVHQINPKNAVEI